jgi:hypothetical protein
LLSVCASVCVFTYNFRIAKRARRKARFLDRFHPCKSTAGRKNTIGTACPKRQAVAGRRIKPDWFQQICWSSFKPAREFIQQANENRESEFFFMKIKNVFPGFL